MIHMKKSIFTIDTHTAGEPTRIITAGIPHIPGKTMAEKKRWLSTEYDSVRTMLMLEPRGHRDMFGAVLTESPDPAADIGVIFMDSGGYLDMCGHGSIGVTTAVIESGMVTPRNLSGQSGEITLDTPAGLITARFEAEKGKVRQVTIRNVDAFCHSHHCVTLQSGVQLNVSISYGGNYFALVPAGELHLTISGENIATFVELGMEIRASLNATLKLVHPLTGTESQVNLVEFYDEATPAANIVIFGDGQFDRSPCGTGTCAKMAFLHAENRLALGTDYRYRSICDTEFTGRLIEAQTIDGITYVTPEITGQAFITGYHQFVADPDDPFYSGLTLP